MEKIVWDQSKIDELTELWLAGFTASVISKKMGGISKNAIVGKAARLNLPKRVNAHIPRVERQPRRAALQAAKLQPEPQPDMPPEGGVPFEELSGHHCREIVGWDPGASGLARYCGSRRIKNSSYCATHHAKNYQPMRARS